MAAPSTIGQVRDVFPKLGELTDKVVFGDVGSGPGFPSATAASSPSPRWSRSTGPTRSAATSGARSTTA